MTSTCHNRKNSITKFQNNNNAFGAQLHIVQDFGKSFLRKRKSRWHRGLMCLDGTGSQFLCLPGVLLWCLPEEVDNKPMPPLFL